MNKKIFLLFQAPRQKQKPRGRGHVHQDHKVLWGLIFLSAVKEKKKHDVQARMCLWVIVLNHSIIPVPSHPCRSYPARRNAPPTTDTDRRMTPSPTASTAIATATLTLTRPSSTSHSTRTAGTSPTASMHYTSTSTWTTWYLAASRGPTWSRLPQTGASAASTSSPSGRRWCRRWRR